MKPLIVFILALAFSTGAAQPVQAQEAKDALSQQLDEIVTVSHGQDLSALVIKEFQFVKEVSSLPSDQYALAIRQVGERYSAEPKEMFRLLSKLQYQCRRDRLQSKQNARLGKTPTQKWLQAVYESSEDFLSDLNISGQFLPAILAAHAAEQLPADQRGCPYDLLFHMASSPNEMDEQVRRAENSAVADIANDVAAGIPAAIAVASVAQRAGFMAIEWGRLSTPVIVAGVVSLTISQVIKSYGASLREGVLLKNWQKMKSQLEQGISSSSNATDAEASEFYLATMQLYAFYSYDLIAAQSRGQTQETPFNVRSAYANQCSSSIDQRLLLEALKNRDLGRTMDLLKISTCIARYEFTQWLAEWNGNRGFKDVNEMRRVRRNFITSDSPERTAFIENLEKKLHKSWGNCPDPLYFLFTVADTMNSWDQSNPHVFETHGELLDVKNRIESKLFSTAQIRHDVLEATTIGPSACVFGRE